MSDTIKGSIIGAIITVIGSILVFVLGNFSTQSIIEEKTVKTLSGYFDSVNKDMSYEQALQTIYKENESLKMDISDLKTQLDELDKQINSKQAEIDAQSSIEEINDIIQSATDYWNNSEYIQCLTLLNSEKSKSSDIEALYKQYSEEYVMKLLLQADKLVAERKYNQAIKLLKEGQLIVNNNEKINNKINAINSNKPIGLSDLKISASRFFEQSLDKPLEDTVGNKYSIENKFTIYAEGDSEYGYSTFYLGKKYTSLSGIIAVSDESENRSDTQLKGWIEIGIKNRDKFKSLWTSKKLSRTTSPIKIPKISLSKAEWLEIRYYNDENYYSLAGGYHSLRIIITNVKLYND